MAYDYVKRTYDVAPVVGGRVKHTVTGESGVVAPESPGQAHYVRVKFDGKSFSLPCHPTELEYLTTKPKRHTISGSDAAEDDDL